MRACIGNDHFRPHPGQSEYAPIIIEHTKYFKQDVHTDYVNRTGHRSFPIVFGVLTFGIGITFPLFYIGRIYEQLKVDAIEPARMEAKAMRTQLGKPSGQGIL